MLEAKEVEHISNPGKTPQLTFLISDRSDEAAFALHYKSKELIQLNEAYSLTEFNFLLQVT